MVEDPSPSAREECMMQEKPSYEHYDDGPRARHIPATSDDRGALATPATPLPDADHDDEDDVCDASLDSFPASDPPSWTGLHIGGPARRAPVPVSDPQLIPGDGRLRVATDHRLGDGEWLARRWPDVHLRVAELLTGPGDDVAAPTVRAVVQLGTLTPADVRVIAEPALQTVESASARQLRLTSVRSHHNGAVVFEAAVTQNTLSATTAFVVTVSPAPRLLAGRPLPAVVGLVRSTERTRDIAVTRGTAASQASSL
jgi:hypothetical protein